MRENKTLSLSDVMPQARKKTQLLPVTIRLASEDIATARQLADDKGVGYQNLDTQLLLHETLQRRPAVSRQASRRCRFAGVPSIIRLPAPSRPQNHLHQIRFPTI